MDSNRVRTSESEEETKERKGTRAPEKKREGERNREFREGRETFIDSICIIAKVFGEYSWE